MYQIRSINVRDIMTNMKYGNAIHLKEKVTEILVQNKLKIILEVLLEALKAKTL